MGTKSALTLFLLIATVLAVSPKKTKDQPVEISSEAPQVSSEKPTIDIKNLKDFDVDPGFYRPKNKTKSPNKTFFPAVFPSNKTDVHPDETEVIDPGFRTLPPVNKTKVQINDTGNIDVGDVGIIIDIAFPPANTPDLQLEDLPNNTKAIADNFTNEYTLLLNPLLGIFFEIAKLLEESDKKTGNNANATKRQKQFEELAKNFEKEIEKLTKMDAAAQALYVQEINFANNLAKWTTVANELLFMKEQDVLRSFDAIFSTHNNILETEWKARRLRFKLKLLEEDLKFVQTEILALKIECPRKFAFLVKTPAIECIDEANLKHKQAKTESALQKVQTEQAALTRRRITENKKSEAVHIQFDKMNEKYEEVFSIMQLIKRQSRLARKLHKGIADQTEELRRAIKGKEFSTKEVAKNVKETMASLGPLVLETAEAPEVKAQRRKYLSAIVDKVEKTLK